MISIIDKISSLLDKFEDVVATSFGKFYLEV